MTTEEINPIEKQKDEVFGYILDLLLTIGGEEMDGIDRAGHVMDVLEEITARVIASCSGNEAAVDELSDTFTNNMRLLAHDFLKRDLEDSKKAE